MTQAWDAARAASKRSIRKPYKPVAPIVMPVVRLESHAGYRIGGVVMGYAEWALDTKCGSCGFNVCCCNTNRKFQHVSKTGFRTLKVGDVLVGKGYKGDGSAHGDEVLIVAELDVLMRSGCLGVRAHADSDDRTKLSTWRYGYLREYFEATDFGGCRKHGTLWDTSNPDIPHECGHCKREAEDSKALLEDARAKGFPFAQYIGPKPDGTIDVPLFKVEAVKPEDAETASAATAVVNHMAKHLELWTPTQILDLAEQLNSDARPKHLMDGIDPVKLDADMEAMRGFNPSGINSVVRGKEYELAPVGCGKQITATPEQAKLLEVPYKATIPIGRNYRFPVEKNPISDFKDFGNHADEPMEQWSLEQLKTRMDELMDMVIKNMTNIKPPK